MYKLYSERNREMSGDPQLYVYDSFPPEFRHQLYLIVNDVIEKAKSINHENYWIQLYSAFCREKGLESFGDYVVDYNNDEFAKWNIKQYIKTSNASDLLDIMDFLFFILNTALRNIFSNKNSLLGVIEAIENANDELNHRFQQHNLGYELINNEIVRIDNQNIHANYIKPALNLLHNNDFKGAEEEYMNALKAVRSGNEKTAIIEATKAFESTMKTICIKRNYNYNSDNDTAKKLIGILRDNRFFPSYLDSHLNTLVKALEDGAPVVRNKTSGHGQGEDIVNIPKCYAEYVIGLVAVNILLLVSIYEEN